jgi:hypothetical protein
VSSSGNNGGFSTDVFTDVTGNFQATDIPVGNITVSTTYADNTTGSGNGVLNNNGDVTTINIGTPPPITTGTIFGTVYDSNQNPNPGATVSVQASDAAMTIVTATTDQNGIYTAPGVPLGAVSVTALLNDGVTTVGPVTGNLPDGITPVEIDLGLSNPGDVSGIVYDVNMNPIPNVNINAASSGDTTVSYGEGTADDGSFDFGGIAPGTITLTVTDNNNTVIGTATGILPDGGNVVINVNTSTVGAMIIPPPLGRVRPEPSLATNPAPQPRTLSPSAFPNDAPMRASTQPTRPVPAVAARSNPSLPQSPGGTR